MNENTDSIVDYTIPVHKSLLYKKQMFGIGDKVFYTILFITILLFLPIS